MATLTLPKLTEFNSGSLARGSDVLANDQAVQTFLNAQNIDQNNINPAMAPVWTGIHKHRNFINLESGYDLRAYSDTGTTLKMSIDASSGNIGVASGAKYFVDDASASSGSYMYASAASQIGFNAGAADRLTLDAASGVYVRQGNQIRLDAAGSTNPKDFLMRVKSSGANFDELWIIAETGVSNETFGNTVATFGATGNITFPLHSTTGSAANAVVDSGTGQLARSTSSLQYKENVKDLEVDSTGIFKLRPVSYDDKNSKKRYFGLIAEEVDTIIPQLVDHNSKTGKCEYVYYDRLSVLLLAEVKKLRTELDDLKKNYYKK